MGRPAKCRFCQKNIETKDAHKVINGKQVLYFCNEEHYQEFLNKKEQEATVKKKEREAKRKASEIAKESAKQKRKADKDKVYYLICDIVGRKEIINTVLWKEWKIWNKVATNEVIGQYLEENKDYLIKVISRIENDEFKRIRYLSAILKNKLGNYKPKVKEEEKPKQQIDITFYEPEQINNNKRRSLADLEDLF